MIKFPLLTSEDIEVKVKQVTKTGALFLLYKTARVDARILDETVGIMNWTNSYETIKDVLYCKVGIRENEDQQFVYKEDCGIESAQDDGNEKKAEASDSFKRVCSKLGIGRELYTSPQIWADVSTVEKNGKWFLSDPYARYVVTRIKYNEDTRVITELEISNAKTNVVVFSWAMSTTGAIAKKMDRTINKSEEVNDPVKEKPVEVTEKKEIKQTSESESLQSLIKGIGLMVKNMMSLDGNKSKYDEIVTDVTGGTTFKCNAATEADYDIVYNIYKKLVEAGYSVN